MTLRSRLGLLLLLLLHVAGLVAMGLAAEHQLGEKLAEVDVPAPPRDPAGRRLYILMVDSLTIDDPKQMPHFTEIGRAGFSMDIEPCFDNFTTACVREMLTGRRAFSLFSVLENFEVTQPGVGPNLFSDARAAGMTTAMLSWGDLRSWSKLVDTDRRFANDEKGDEARIGLELAASHDLVFHHWIWHDVASHHRAQAKAKEKRMSESLAQTDALVAEIAAGLPEDMDLIVTGDHGHAPDGRHVQGMDVPTTLVARSPNLVSMKAAGRPPSAAVRTVAGAVVGLASPASWVDEDWRSWLAPTIGPQQRAVGESRAAEVETGFPAGPLAVAAGVALLAMAVLGWKGGLAVMLWAALAGLAYPEWLEFSLSRGFRSPILVAALMLPLGGALLGGLRGRRAGLGLAGALSGASWGGIALTLGLLPGQGYTGVLKNTPGLLLVVVGVAGLAPLWAAVREPAERRRAGLQLLVLAAALVLVAWVTDFSTNNFRILRYPVLWLFRDAPDLRLVGSALAGLLIHRLVDVDWRYAPLGAAAVLLGSVLPDLAFAAAFLALLPALFALRGPWRGRLISALILLITSYTLARNRQVGALFSVSALGLGVEVIRFAVGRLGPTAGPKAGRVATALLLVVAGLLGLVWTTRLSISGVDFTFAVDWLPGRLHKQLWWIVLSSTLLNCVLPLILVLEIVRSRLGAVGVAGTVLAGRVALLRFGASLVFAGTWMLSVGHSAASIRLHSFLQDAVIWLLIAAVLVVMGVSARPAGDGGRAAPDQSRSMG